MRRVALGLMFLVIAGCSSNSSPTTAPVRGLDEMQGTWKIVYINDPEGKSFEPNQEMVIEIKGDKALSEGGSLRLEFAADRSYMKIFAQIPVGPKNPDGPKQEKQVGEVEVSITAPGVSPVQMLWKEKANKQETFLEKKS